MSTDPRISRIWTPGPLQLWVIVVTTLMVVLFAGVLAAMPISWFYNEWAPARDFRGTPQLKHRRVTVRYSFFHEPDSAIGLVAGAARVVIEAPAYADCSICGVHIAGPAHIRAPIGSESNVRWYRSPRRR